MFRRDFTNCRILVTGASSGIGEALCRQLCQRGAKVLATARRENRLEELARSCEPPGSLQFLVGDITKSDHRARLIEWIEKTWGGLDILVNNAGVGAIGPFQSATEERLRQIMEVDFFAPVELTRVCLPLLSQGDRATVLNIGSVLSHVSVPNKSEYCAAKFALRGWSESIRNELYREGIDVLMLSPSTTRSEFFDSLIETPSDKRSQSIGSMSVTDVAHAAIKVLERRTRDRILSWGGKTLVLCRTILPQTLDRILRRFA